MMISVSELRRGVAASPAPVLAGFELVEIEGVTQLNPAQISAGLSISWDLQHIPLNLLEQVKKSLF